MAGCYTEPCTEASAKIGGRAAPKRLACCARIAYDAGVSTRTLRVLSCPVTGDTEQQAKQEAQERGIQDRPALRPHRGQERAGRRDARQRSGDPGYGKGEAAAG